MFERTAVNPPTTPAALTRRAFRLETHHRSVVGDLAQTVRDGFELVLYRVEQVAQGGDEFDPLESGMFTLPLNSRDGRDATKDSENAEQVRVSRALGR